ncbi:uncharacterized protein LOC141900388 [Tubulanus polymorphus]|uniref:uncharacterized protein LOC141900388 n=1 Tax=Tubulanus polymorphus TaxID=672921 RepID=UPI003DA347FB
MSAWLLLFVFLQVFGAGAGAEALEGVALPYEISALGLGYDVFIGNPSLGHSDPGLKLTRRIFPVQASNNDMGYLYHGPNETRRMPSRVRYFERRNCISEQDTRYIIGPKGYQDARKRDIILTDGDYDKTSSQIFADSKALGLTTESEFFLTERRRFCPMGEARLRTKYTDDFAYEFLRELIKTDFNDLKTAKLFFARWGTHVVTGIHFGTKDYVDYSLSSLVFLDYILKNNKQSLMMCSSLHSKESASFLEVTLMRSSLDSVENLKQNFNLKSKVDIGSPGKLAPVRWVLTPITEMYKWYRGSSSFKQSLRENLENATELIMQDKSAKVIEDPEMKFMIKWPGGMYALPAASGGCPSKEAEWKLGWRFQDAPSRYVNKWNASMNSNWNGAITRGSVNSSFCVKTITYYSTVQYTWPRGQYCILKKGISCPIGFNESTVKWKDALVNSRNSIGGILPEGVYNTNSTDISYCCRNDGDVNKPIVLPNEHPFYLLARAQIERCQQVYGMHLTTETLGWGTDNSNYAFQYERVKNSVRNRYNRIVRYTYETKYDTPLQQNDGNEKLQVMFRYCHYKPDKPAHNCRICDGCEYPGIDQRSMK